MEIRLASPAAWFVDFALDLQPNSGHYPARKQFSLKCLRMVSGFPYE